MTTASLVMARTQADRKHAVETREVVKAAVSKVHDTAERIRRMTEFYRDREKGRRGV